jgi:tungstate transport system ATP-binding protein
MTLFDLEGIKRTYGKRIVLDIPALQLHSGKIYTLVGPNGAGKTTLLHLLAFLDTATEGNLYFQEEKAGGSSESLLGLRRKVVLVDQYPILFTGPVWKNLDFGLKIRKLKREIRRKKIKEALELVGMEDFYHRDAHNLSGGETKRIALARALVLEPEVLLCDEPTANVDSKHQEIILQILERSNRERGLSIIFATHYLSQAQRLAHHSLVLQNGRLSSTSRENMFSARMFSQGEIFCVYRLGEGLQLKVPRLKDTVFSENATIFLSPENLEIKTVNFQQPGENRFTGVVMKTENENGHIRVSVDVGLPLEIFISMNEYHTQPVWIGQAVSIIIPDSAITVSA